jgi:putative membrane protein
VLKLVKNFFNGLVLGITQIVPGVSGSTVAIILGFYMELIETINHITKDIRKKMKFLIPILLGIAVGMVLFSSIVDFLLTNYSFPTMLFFIGLIVGIIPHIYSKAMKGKLKLNSFLLILIPFIVLLATSGLTGISVGSPQEAINNINLPFMIFLFFAGIIGAAALVIPGLSGSFILLLFGIYPLAIYSVSSIRVLLTDITNITLMLNIFKVLIPFGIGVIFGIVSTARLIEKLLKRHSKPTYSVILGLISGSVFVLFRNPMVYASGVSTVIIAIGMATFFSGVVISFVLGKKHP